MLHGMFDKGVGEDRHLALMDAFYLLSVFSQSGRTIYFTPVTGLTESLSYT